MTAHEHEPCPVANPCLGWMVVGHGDGSHIAMNTCHTKLSLLKIKIFSPHWCLYIISAVLLTKCVVFGDLQLMRELHLSVACNWHCSSGIAIWHQSRPMDLADINMRLQLSDPSLHLWGTTVSRTLYCLCPCLNAIALFVGIIIGCWIW